MDFNPLTELGVIQYCILERIGRSRFQGEVTQGKRGLQVVTDDPKMLYYFRKLLVKNKLVMKQLFYMKVHKQTSTGSLIHLPRFYTEIKTRQDADAIKLATCLENTPSKCMPLKSVKTTLNMELKKLLIKYPNNFKTAVVPYRTVNPSSKPSDWKMKSTGEERSVRVVMLINSNLSKDDDEDEDDEEEIGLMDESQRRLDRCLIRQAYSLVEKSGPKGIKQSTLGNLLAVPSLQARSICKHLVKKKLVRTVLIDVGRQRIS
ncbi:general transcription factor 3C polypeptide 1-like, partial [Halyomorpha halys]